MTRRYLVTGAQGLVGRYLVAELLRRDPDAELLGIGRSPRLDGTFTHALSTPNGPRRAPLPPSLVPASTSASASADAARYRYRSVSLADSPALAECLAEFRPHGVFHLASALHTAPERELFETNVTGTAALMKALSGAGLETARVVLGSSASVYGEPTSLPLHETAVCTPADVYGVTKLSAEHLTRIAARRAGFEWLAARIFNVVGPGQSEDHVCARFASQLAALDARGGGVLEVGPLETTRDFVDVRDVAEALVVLMERGAPGTTYNVASGRETPIQHVLDELLATSGLNGRVELRRRADRPGGVTRHVADLGRLRELGFSPRFLLRASLSDLYRYHAALLRDSELQRAHG